MVYTPSVSISLIEPQPQEVQHECFPSGRFPSAVPQSQLEKKIPSRHVSSCSADLLGDLVNVTSPASPGGGSGVSSSHDEGQSTGNETERLLGMASFYNFSINNGLPILTNHCNGSVIRKIFKRQQAIQWNIVIKRRSMRSSSGPQ